MPFLTSVLTTKTMSNDVPEYCQVLKITAADGTVKQMIFPKALDLNRPKRPRTTFSDEQLKILKKEFDKNPYLVGKERQKLAKELQLTETQVKVWFQNKRTKHKKSPGLYDFLDVKNSSSSSSTDEVAASDVSKNDQEFKQETIKKEETAEALSVTTNPVSQYFPLCFSSNAYQFYPHNCCF